MQVRCSLPVALLFCILSSSTGRSEPAPDRQPPRVLACTPAIGARDVDPALDEISVTFDRDMNTDGCSWTGGGPAYPEVVAKPRWTDKRTCVLPVKLQPGHDYRVGINAPSFQNFQSAAGVPAFLTAIFFGTAEKAETAKAASAKTSAEQRRRNERAFDELGRLLRERYSYYDLRRIDWEKVFAESRDWLLDSRTDLEWASRAGNTLAVAGDIHMSLECEGKSIGTHFRNVPANFSLRAIEAAFPDLKMDQDTAWARTEDGILYLLIGSWSAATEPRISALEKALLDKPAKAAIVDVRPNAGGAEPLAIRLAAWFHDTPTTYSKNAYRDPAAPGGWTQTFARVVRPNAPDRRFPGPVAVLIGPHCMSSCESFILAMKTSPRCKLIGQKTYGSSGNPKPHALSNGVTIYLPSWKDLTPDGRVLEGVGIRPDLFVSFPADGTVPGDPILEAALEYLKSELRPKP